MHGHAGHDTVNATASTNMMLVLLKSWGWSTEQEAACVMLHYRGRI